MKNLRYVAVSIISVLVIFTIYTNMTVVKTKGKTSNVANSFWKEAKSKNMLIILFWIQHINQNLNLNIGNL